MNKSTSIPRSRQGSDSDEVLVGEIIDRGVPLGRPVVDAEPKAPPRKLGKLRTTFIVILSVSALICLGGLVSGYIWYHNASEPDRSTPNLTVAQYLTARFDQRDNVVAAHFVCHAPNLGNIDAFEQDIDARGRRADTAIMVSWENFGVTGNGNSAVVTVDIRLTVTIDNVMQREIQHWQFDVIREGGWRVCGGQQVR